MSFGVGIGDIFDTLRLLIDLRQRFLDAPVQFKAIVDEYALPLLKTIMYIFLTYDRVKALNSAIVEVTDSFRPLDLTGKQKQLFSDTWNMYQAVIADLQKYLDEFQVLDPSVRRKGGKLQSAWKRLICDQKDIDEFRKRIRSSVDGFHFFLQCVNRSAISESKWDS